MACVKRKNDGENTGDSVGGVIIANTADSGEDIVVTKNVERCAGI